MPFCLVEEEAVSLISSLQMRSIPMLGLTAMRTGSYGIIASMEEWRVNQLRHLGIDFSSLYPRHSKMSWEEISPAAGRPAFREGIICCDRVPKGVVLTTFFQKIDWLPKQVLFIDDNFSFLRSVEESMEALNIPFTGVHYRAVEHMEAPLDEELAHHQFQILINEERWLPDAEAKASLLEKKEQTQRE